MRRKYSCLGKERKLLESVSMPMNLLSSPILERAFNCFTIPSFWSRNHHPEPYWIFPATEPSLKFPTMVAKRSLSAGLRLETIVFARQIFLSSLSRNVASYLPCEKSPIESQPVSGPSCFIILELLFLKAPRWYC